VARFIGDDRNSGPRTVRLVNKTPFGNVQSEHRRSFRLETIVKPRMKLIERGSIGRSAHAVPMRSYSEDPVGRRCVEQGRGRGIAFVRGPKSSTCCCPGVSAGHRTQAQPSEIVVNCFPKTDGLNLPIRAAMIPLVRLTSLFLLAFSAQPADGAISDDEAAHVAIDSAAMALDRDVRMSEAFAASSSYVGAAPLEQQACSSFDKRRQLRGRLAPLVIRAASEQLNLPMGSGRFISVLGERFLFCLEPHYRAPGTGEGRPQGWHKGVTVYDAS
jgi:hypothetical protein